jgi:hypothetical protein
MTYATGETPRISDNVKHTSSGRTGIVVQVQNPIGIGGRGQVTVVWDGGGGVAVSAANEYELLER